MRRSTKKFIASAIGVGAVGVALPVLATGTAYATGDHCDRVSVEYSLDGGKTWTTKGRMDGNLVTKIQVRIAGDLKNTCEYAVSLASYSAEGPSWSTSGKQAFLGWDTTKLSKQNKKATLDVSAYAPKCFGQVDLYGNGKKYDGVQNPLPHYKDAPFPTNLITAWNGGHECETPTKPPTTEPATSKPPTDDNTKTPPATSPPATSKPPTDDDTKTPPATSPPATSKPPTTGGTPSTTSSVPSTSKPSTTAPAPVGGGDTSPPEGTPEVPPVTDIAPAALAETGGDSNAAVLIGASAGALLIGGAGVLVWNRRRNSGGAPA